MSLSLSYLKDVSKNQIDIIPHALKKDTISPEWIYDCLLNKEPRGILTQRDNRFRIYYNHPTKEEKYDFIIVIDIIKFSTKCIRVVTTYEQSVKRRIR